MLWKSLFVAQDSFWLPPLTPFPQEHPASCNYPPLLGMNSELYMLLQAGQSLSHWTHLDYQDVSI